MSDGSESPATAIRTDGSIPLLGARKKAREFLDRIRQLEAALEETGALSYVEMKEQIEEASGRRDKLQAEVDALSSRVVAMEEAELLQEVGIYEYRHPLDDAVSYQDALKDLKSQFKVMTKKDGGAVHATTDWQVNGSKAQGRKMVNQTSKLLLRAYNAEADNLARGMKPYKLDASIDRLNKVVQTISKLGQTMSISISEPYHQLRVRELEFTSDFITKKAEEKEREKEARARLREEKKAQQEMERERKRLEKEREHHLNVIQKLRTNGDEEAAARLEKELGEIDKAIENVDYRAANVRAGYVYVVSNIGSLGDGIVKVGMTRRLDPMDRVRELSDASVPFNFDIHALFFSDDAVGVEGQIHERLANRRINRINLRREFFYATPGEVKALLLDVAGDVLEFEEEPEAIEYRQSARITEGAASD